MKKLSDVGERAAIRRIFQHLSKGFTTVPIGDDCAAIDISQTDYLLVTTDMISQATHIPKGMTPYQIGWFLVAINLSDIAAKGGTPLGLVLSFGLPRNTSEKFLTDLTRGADACATRYGTTIVGGDTKETSEITLCGTAFGTVKKEEFMPRKGIRPGNIVAVTGTLGKAGAGYLAVKENIPGNALRKPLFEPVPRLKEGLVLAQQHGVTSCMDLSDGLSSSLYQLQEINNVGFEISSEMLPVASEISLVKKKKPHLDVSRLVLHFGGDYELLLTLPPELFEKTKTVLQQWGADLFMIGKVTRKKTILLVEGKKKTILENKGYEHFKKRYF